MTNPTHNPFSENEHNKDTGPYDSTYVEMDYNPPQKLNGNSFLNSPLINEPENHALGSEFDSFKPSTFQNSTSVPAKLPTTNVDQDYEDSLNRRERTLRERERNLEAQARVLEEQRLEQQAESERLRASAPAGFRPANNFPFFYPIMYHSINNEIGITERSSVKLLYQEWLSLLVCLVFNFIACLVLLLSPSKGGSGFGEGFAGSLIYCFTISISSFFLWYRPVYNAYMKDSALFYVIFFVFNGCHVVFAFYMSVGIPGSGSAGLIYFIRTISAGHILGTVFTAINTAIWFVHSFFALTLFKKTYSHYSNRGHSFSEAKSQAYVGFASNRTVQNAAVSMATTR